MLYFILLLIPVINAANVNQRCSTLHPTSNIRSVTVENKELIGEYYKCLFEENNANQPFTEEDDFIKAAIELFPDSSNGNLYLCFEENGELSQQNPSFYFDFVNCLVREVIDDSEQYCLYRSPDDVSYFNCLQEQTTKKATAVPSEFKDQSMEYSYRVAQTTYDTCKSARSSQSFVSCIRQSGQERSDNVQGECDIDFSQYDLNTIADDEQKKIVGNGYKCALNKLNTKQLPSVYPSFELFYKKPILTITNCQRRNNYSDDWNFYFKFAKCIEA
ncbi:hypothetical protein ACFFRR_000540 [Megaselia abdita]